MARLGFHAGGAGTRRRIPQLAAGFCELLRRAARAADSGAHVGPDEDDPARNHVSVLTETMWRSRFDADPRVVGRVIRIDGEPAEIVGVVADNSQTRQMFGMPDLFRPLGLTAEERVQRGEAALRILGRYRPGIAREAAQAHFELVARRLVANHPKENAGLGLRAVSLPTSRLGSAGVTITYMLLGLSGFVLLIACANLANLLVARAVTRTREFAIRAALGASAVQLIRPLIVECIVLAAAGGALGVQLSVWTNGWLGRSLVTEGPPLEFPLDWRVLGFAMGVALATVLVFGVAPAWVVSRVRVNDTLKGGARGTTADLSQHRLRNGLMVGQFALALVLLGGAAMFVRGVASLAVREAGWQPALLVTGKIALPPSLSRDPDRTMQFYGQLRERLAALPGVENASVDIELPLFGFAGARGYLIEGRERPQAGQEPAAVTNAVSPEYSRPSTRGSFAGAASCRATRVLSPPVIVVNEAMARALFPGGDALGHRLGRAGLADPGWAEIVGIAENVRFLNLEPQGTTFQVYRPLTQETWGYVNATVKARDAATAAGLVEPFRRAVSDLNPDLPVLTLMPVPALIARSVQDLRTINRLLTGFAALGLFLAALGIYGVVARLVAQRTIEIGIRMALGARLDQVVRLVLRTGLRITCIGAGIGMLGAIALTRTIATQLPGLETSSTLIVAGATLLLVSVSAVACYLPARRAATIDPLIAMRAE